MEKFKCLNEKCGHEWEGIPKPPHFCEECGGLYCEWVTFKDWDHDGEIWFKPGT